MITCKNDEKPRIFALIAALCLLLCAVLVGGSAAFKAKGEAARADIPENSYGSLNLAAQIVKIGNEYFIEDGYNHQIIYSENLSAPLSSWKVMASGINRGHSVAGDGHYYIIDDTDNETFIGFIREDDGSFTKVATINVGGSNNPTMDVMGTNRPHYVVYDENTRKFYGLVSMTGEIYVFKCENDNVTTEKVMKIDELDGEYVRSFSIIDGDIYFVSGNGNIIRASLDNLSVIKRYPVPDTMRSMVNLMKIDGYYYISVSGQSPAEQAANAGLFRTSDLSELKNYGYENITHLFGGKGIPYYMSAFDNKYYVAMQEYGSVRLDKHIYEFSVSENEITSVSAVF